MNAKEALNNYVFEIHAFDRAVVVTILTPTGGQPMRLYGDFNNASDARAAIEFFLECAKAGRCEIKERCA